MYANDLFNPEYCSKGFGLGTNIFTNSRRNETIQDFKKQQIIHGAGAPMDVNTNLKELSPMILKSFLNVVSETVCESYVPFPTENLIPNFE